MGVGAPLRDVVCRLWSGPADSHQATGPGAPWSGPEQPRLQRFARRAPPPRRGVGPLSINLQGRWLATCTGATTIMEECCDDEGSGPVRPIPIRMGPPMSPTAWKKMTMALSLNRKATSSTTMVPCQIGWRYQSWQPRAWRRDGTRALTHYGPSHGTWWLNLAISGKSSLPWLYKGKSIPLVKVG